MWEICEGLARDILESIWLDSGPQDAFKIARACSLTLVPGPGSRGSLSGTELTYPVTARPQRQHGIIAHEVGHWALLTSGEQANDESAAHHVGNALLLPAIGFSADLKRTAWQLDALRAKHVNVSAERIARRITQLRDAVVTIIDNGRTKQRVVSPWMNHRHFARLTDWEHLAADEALATGETVYLDDLCYAFPVFDGAFKRVIVVCEAEQLALKL